MNLQRILNSRLTTLALIALVAVLSIHVLPRFTEGARADLTADDLYSLSEGTEMILGRMQSEGVKPLAMTLYFSETTGKTLPEFIKDFLTYEKYLRALLKEYETRSQGKVKVSFIDPAPDSDEAQDALAFGLDGKPINQYGDLFFFGLVLETQTGSKEVIDFLWPNRQETVEYEISKRLHGLIWPTRQRLGVLAGLPVISDASNPYMAQILAAQGKQPQESWLAMTLLEETYAVQKIDPDSDSLSAEELDLLLVIHPRDLPEKTLFAIDEWVVKGGNTLIFLDPFSIDDQPPQNPQQPWAAMQYKPSSNLAKLLEKWGVRRIEDQVAADFNLAVSRPVAQRGPAQRLLVDLAINAQTTGSTLAPGHPIFQGVTDLRFFLAGALETIDGASDEIERTPLITTTAEGSTLQIQAGFPSGETLTFADVNNPGKLADHFEPGTEPVVLAYAISGKLDSAFPEGGSFPASTPAPPPGMPPGMQMPPAADAEMIDKAPVPEDQRAVATVLVYADVDLLSDQIAFQQSFFGTAAANDNYKVLLNSVDFLLGSEELMKVRGKKPIQRPFLLFDEIEARADRDTLEREGQLRAEVERFQDELSEKQRGLGSKNAALFQKQLQDEVDDLNNRIQQANGELREIRKEKRRALEGEERQVRFSTLFVTPSLVLALGLALFIRRRRSGKLARRGQ